jgi:hypothetical protein
LSRRQFFAVRENIFMLIPRQIPSRPGQDKIVAGFSLIVLLLCTHCSSQTDPRPLRLGSIMPAISGETLAGSRVDLPSAAAGKPAVVIFSFSRAGGRDAQNWAQRLAIRDPRVPVYTVIFLESVPRIIRGMAVSAIKSGMPPDMQGRSIVLFRDEQSWKQGLQLSDESHACVALIGADGTLQWTNSESLTDARFAQLTKQIEALK